MEFRLGLNSMFCFLLVFFKNVTLFYLMTDSQQQQQKDIYISILAHLYIAKTFAQII